MHNIRVIVASPKTLRSTKTIARYNALADIRRTERRSGTPREAFLPPSFHIRVIRKRGARRIKSTKKTIAPPEDPQIDYKSRYGTNEGNKRRGNSSRAIPAIVPDSANWKAGAISQPVVHTRMGVEARRLVCV